MDVQNTVIMVLNCSRHVNVTVTHPSRPCFRTSKTISEELNWTEELYFGHYVSNYAR